MKRRQFTHSLIMLSGGGALLAGAGLSTTVNALRNMIAAPPQMSRSLFESKLGQLFHVSGEAESTLMLAGVMDASPHAPNAQFHVIFEGSPGATMAEGTHRLEHAGTGPIELFLTRFDRSDLGPRFTATFNLLTSA